MITGGCGFSGKRRFSVENCALVFSFTSAYVRVLWPRHADRTSASRGLRRDPAYAALGNFVEPLQIGAPDMTLPKINMASYQVFFVGGVIMLISFFVPGGAAKGGWTSYTPLAVISDKGPTYDAFWNGQTLWLVGFVFLITSS